MIWNFRIRTMDHLSNSVAEQSILWDLLWNLSYSYRRLIFVSEMTYNVSSGTLNTTIPYHRPIFMKLGELTESDKGINPLHFGSDPADTNINITSLI